MAWIELVWKAARGSPIVTPKNMNRDEEMGLFELHQRMAKWEDLHTEFKEWPVYEDDLSASLVAFANTDGGRLTLSVTNDRLYFCKPMSLLYFFSDVRDKGAAQCPSAV